MLKIFLLLVISTSLIAPSHDIQVAFFKIYEGDHIVHIDFVFEKEDLLLALDQDESNTLNEELQHYLQENFSITINNKIRSLNYSKAIIENKHISINGSLSKQIEAISSIKIANKCLLNIDDHSNIIEIRLQDQERDFLMNTDRTTISVNY